MRRSWTSRVKPFAGILALVMAVTFTAPAFAAEPTPAAEKAPTRPLSAAVTATLGSMPVPAAAVTQEPAADTQSAGKPFFKTRTGAIALILMAGGLGYTLYSKDKDRILSPIR